MVCLACIRMVLNKIDVGYNVRLSCVVREKKSVSEAKWMAPKSKMHHSHSLHNGLQFVVAPAMVLATMKISSRKICARFVQLLALLARWDQEYAMCKLDLSHICLEGNVERKLLSEYICLACPSIHTAKKCIMYTATILVIISAPYIARDSKW